MRIIKSEVKSSLIDNIFDKTNTVFMLLLCIVIIYPLYYVLIASFTEPHIVSSGVLLFYPVELFVGGYKRILNYPPIWTGYLNTIKYTFVGTTISICVTVPAAYALSRKDMFLRRQIMMLFTFTMFFSGGLIPLYLLINKINIYNTIWAVTLPTAVSVWNLIICRSFFESNIPDEMLEAARIDGCHDFGFFFQIVLPLSSTIIAVMILFYSTTTWNSFMNALMFLGDAEKMPLQVVLRNLIIIDQATALTTDTQEMILRQKLAEQLKYGVIVVSALPLLCVYPFLQKYFAKGVMVGAIKG
jgi:putative aldouronate transport system permease protein